MSRVPTDQPSRPAPVHLADVSQGSHGAPVPALPAAPVAARNDRLASRADAVPAPRSNLAAFIAGVRPGDLAEAVVDALDGVKASVAAGAKWVNAKPGAAKAGGTGLILAGAATEGMNAVIESTRGHVLASIAGAVTIGFGVATLVSSRSRTAPGDLEAWPAVGGPFEMTPRPEGG